MGQKLGPFTHISLEQGLSDRNVKDIVRDDLGYLWIGTRNGLNRYDGLHVEIYDNHPERQTRISAKEIKKVLPRKDGQLVVQYETNRRFLDVLFAEETVARKLFLNRENGVVGVVEKVQLSEKTGDLHLLVKQDSSLVVQKLNNQYTFDSLYQVQGHVAKRSSLFNFVVLPSDEAWINDNNLGLFCVDTAGQITNTIYHDSLGVPHQFGQISILHHDDQGRIWLAFQNAPGLWEYNEAARDFTPFKVGSQNVFNSIWEDGLGQVLVGYKVSDHILDLHLIKSDDGTVSYNKFLQAGATINEIYSKDFERLVFLGTDRGVKKINQTKKHVSNYLHNDERIEVETSLRGIATTPSGHVIFNGEKNTWYVHSPASDSITTLTMSRRHLEPVSYCNCARELVLDSNGMVWGVRYSDLYAGELIGLDLSTSTFSIYAFPYKIQSLTLGNDGNLWLVSGEEGVAGRMTAFDLDAKTFLHYFSADDINPLAAYTPTSIYEDSRGVKWVGTHDGLLEIDVEKGEKTTHNFSESDYFGLSSNYVYCVSEDHEQNIWIGTDAGVNVYYIATDEFKLFDTRDGLADNNVCGILEDDKHNLWFSTYNGLSYFDAQLKSFRNFGVSDGFSQNQFNRYSYHRSERGQFYIGGVNGLSTFNPNELLERDLNAPIILSSLSYYDQEEGAIIERLHNLHQIEEVRLPASNRYFECSFALADYTHPKQNQYQYKLEGLDIDWNYLGTQNEIRFNNLPAGNYTLQIRGADRNLNVSSSEFSIPIKVEQYFYRKGWFLLLVLSLISLVIYFVHRLTLRQAINMERFRTKISSDLHDDVGGLLSGLAMQTELLQYTAKDSDKPKLKRISEMSRNAMAQMRDVIWATDARKDKFEDLLIRMKEYAAEILFPREITCDFNVVNINREKKIPVQIRQNLYLIFKEAITNVAKHSNATNVIVKFEKEGSKLSLEIKDNGQYNKQINGVTSSLNGSGLKNMELRAENIDADLVIDKSTGFSVALHMKSFV
ncbi:MAG: hypothetical protein HKN87_07910 [Saprospiraceae bacterium]|nr:hypothetical protein [Saprospiraceae bacterium]